MTILALVILVQFSRQLFQRQLANDTHIWQIHSEGAGKWESLGYQWGRWSQVKFRARPLFLQMSNLDQHHNSAEDWVKCSPPFLLASLNIQHHFLLPQSPLSTFHFQAKFMNVPSTWCSDKEPTHQWRRCKSCGFDPWLGSIPGGGNGNSFQCSYLSRKFHGQRSLVAIVYGVTESDTAEQMSTLTRKLMNRTLGEPRTVLLCVSLLPMCLYTGLFPALSLISEILQLQLATRGSAVLPRPLMQGSRDTVTCFHK